MEHGLGARRAVTAPVVLYPHNGGPVLARTSEVSISGMFVEAPAALLAAHEVIDVEMTVPASAGMRTFRWQAMVIRRTPSGVGLMFDRLRPPAITRLLANLDAGPAPARPESRERARVVSLKKPATEQTAATSLNRQWPAMATPAGATGLPAGSSFRHAPRRSRAGDQ